MHTCDDHLRVAIGWLRLRPVTPRFLLTTDSHTVAATIRGSSVLCVSAWLSRSDAECPLMLLGGKVSCIQWWCANPETQRDREGRGGERRGREGKRDRKRGKASGGRKGERESEGEERDRRRERERGGG